MNMALVACGHQTLGKARRLGRGWPKADL